MAAIDTYLQTAMRRESGGNPNARNPRSSASGLYQFIDSTYLPYARRLRPGVPDDQLIAMKNDPTIQDGVMRAFTQDNADVLTKANIPVDNGSLYAAHFLGPQGASKMLSADPNTPVEDIVGPAVIRANPQLAGKTAGQFKEWASSGKWGGNPADLPSAGATEVQGQFPGGFQFGGQGPDYTDTHDSEYGFGDALMLAGAALASRDNPQQAAALIAAQKATQADKKSKKGYQFTYDPYTGQAFIVDPNTGRVQVQKYDRKPDRPETKNPKVFTQFDETNQKFQGNADVAQEAQDIQEMIADGRLNVSLLNQTEERLKQLVNSSSPEGRAISKFLGFKERLRNEWLMLQKGVQTEGDAQRAMANFFPPGSTYDTKTALEQIGRIEDISKRTINDLAVSNKTLAGSFNYLDPEGSRTKAYDERLSAINSRTDAIRQKREALLAPQTTQKPQATSIDDEFEAWKNKNKR